VKKMTPDGVEYVRNEWLSKTEQLTNEDVREQFIEYLNLNNI
jgi:hypothetical protein